MFQRFVPVCAVMLIAACSGVPEAPDLDPPPISSSPVGLVLDHAPDPVDPKGRYLIYLHNHFAETAGLGDQHPEFGAYDMQAILEAFAERRFTVIAQQREPRSDVNLWAGRTSALVEELLDGGVAPSRIAVVGFSKGGVIAVLAASELANPDLNFVFLAACGEWVGQIEDLEPQGRLLSIRESSDDMVSSCSRLFALAPDGSQTHEIELDVGGGHGAFFAPRSEWVMPTIAWAHGDDIE